MPPKGVWEGPHAIIHFVNDDDVVPFPRALVLVPSSLLTLLPFMLVKCARFLDGELNRSPAKEEGLSCGGSYSYNHLS
eukprot:scaffold11537_cov129-Isochrysis_galbana.AAC.2